MSPSRPASYFERRREAVSCEHKKAIGRVVRAERYRDRDQASVKPLRSSTAWQRLRLLIMRASPLCSDPFGHHAKEGVTVPAAEVHHIVEAVEDTARFFDPANLSPLCRACHAMISGLERAGRPRPKCRALGPTDAITVCVIPSTTKAAASAGPDIAIR